MAEHIAEQTPVQIPDQTPDQTPAPSRRFQCRHIRASGNRCGSPCLRGENFCYYHHNSRRPTKFLGQIPHEAVFALPSLEDHASVQIALADVLARVAANSLDPKRAGLLLYGIKLASYNLRRMDPPSSNTRTPDPHPSEVDAVIEDIEVDPQLGPLAPVNEVISPEVKETSLRQRFMDFCNSPARVCHRCAERDRLDANRAEAGRLILEREREEPNNLEIRRLADRIRATLPDLKASTDPDNAEPVIPTDEPDNDPETWAKFAAHLPSLNAAAESGAPTTV